MAGKSFKQGYGCSVCKKQGMEVKREIPLYERHEGTIYKFSGYVKCTVHGIQEAVPLKDAVK